MTTNIRTGQATYSRSRPVQYVLFDGGHEFDDASAREFVRSHCNRDDYRCRLTGAALV